MQRWQKYFVLHEALVDSQHLHTAKSYLQRTNFVVFRCFRSEIRQASRAQWIDVALHGATIQLWGPFEKPTTKATNLACMDITDRRKNFAETSHLRRWLNTQPTDEECKFTPNNWKLRPSEKRWPQSITLCHLSSISLISQRSIEFFMSGLLIKNFLPM